jgi:hypothetical protein
MEEDGAAFVTQVMEEDNGSLNLGIFVNQQAIIENSMKKLTLLSISLSSI